MLIYIIRVVSFQQQTDVECIIQLKVNATDQNLGLLRQEVSIAFKSGIESCCLDIFVIVENKRLLNNLPDHIRGIGVRELFRLKILFRDMWS